MGLLNLGWAVCFLPLVFVVLSYAVETRRSIAITCTLGTALAALAAVILLGVELTHGRPVYQSTAPIFSYSVIQTPFNAATKTLLAATLQPSIGILVDPLSTACALAVTVSALALQLFLVGATRAAGQSVMLHRAVTLAVSAALGLVLAPGYVQAAGAVGLLALALYLAAADDATSVGLRVAARRLFLTGWLAAVGLLLTAVFLASKFSGAIEAAATSGRRPAATYPAGSNFVALAARWLAVPRGTVTGVGSRTLVLAAVLELVVALLLVGSVALAAGSRRATGAAGVAVAWITVVGLGLGGVGLLARTAVLLEVASHVLPLLGIVGAAAAVACGLAALAPAPLDRRVLWVAASALATAVAGIGLGAVAGAVALAATVALATPAILGALAVVTIQGGGRSVSWTSLGTGTGVAGKSVLTGLVALAGAAGAGSFFARSAILTAAWSGRLPAGTSIDVPARILIAVGVAAAGGLTAAALVRALVPEPEPVHGGRLRRAPRAARSRPVRLGGWLTPTLVAAAGLAACSGLAVLPGVGPSLGAYVATPPAAPAVAVNGIALLAALLLPIAGGWLAWRRWGAPAEPAGELLPAPPAPPRLAMPDWLGGLAALERIGLAAPGRLLLAIDARLETDAIAAIGDGARGLATQVERLVGARRRAPAAALLAGCVIGVAAVVLWVGLQHTGGTAP